MAEVKRYGRISGYELIRRAQIRTLLLAFKYCKAGFQTRLYSPDLSLTMSRMMRMVRMLVGVVYGEFWDGLVEASFHLEEQVCSLPRHNTNISFKLVLARPSLCLSPLHQSVDNFAI